MAYEELAGQFSALSPLAQAGIDPDDVYDDRRAAMVQLAQRNAGLTPPPNPANVAQVDAAPVAVAQPRAQAPSSDATDDAIPQHIAAPQAAPWGARATAPSQDVPANGAPAVPGTVTKSGDPHTTLYNEDQEQYTKGNALADTADQTMRDRIAKRNAAQAQIITDQKNQAQYATPTQLKDENGNVLPQYKPGFGTKVLRGLGNYLTRGGIAGVVAPEMVGGTPYNAPNKQYQQTELTRRNNLARAQAVTANDVANQAAENTAGTADAKEIADAAKARRDSALGVTQEQTALTGQQTSDNNSPEGKAKAADLLDKQTFASRTLRLATDPNLRNLSPQNRTMYMINGRLPDPRQATEGEVALAQATAAWHRDNPGKQPGLDDFNDIQKTAKGTMGDIEAKAAGQMQLRNGATVADRNRASLAHVANDNLDQIEDVVNRRKELFGAAGGRISSVEQMIGSNDPDLVALGNAVHNFAMANAGIHGSRSHENVKDAEEELLNHLKSGPEGIKGGIKSNRQNLQSIIQRVEGGGEVGNMPPNNVSDGTKPPPGSNIVSYKDLK